MFSYGKSSSSTQDRRISATGGSPANSGSGGLGGIINFSDKSIPWVGIIAAVGAVLVVGLGVFLFFKK